MLAVSPASLSSVNRVAVVVKRTPDTGIAVGQTAGFNEVAVEQKVDAAITVAQTAGAAPKSTESLPPSD